MPSARTCNTGHFVPQWELFMILDWVTCRLERTDCPDWGGWNVLSTWGERIVRYCPKTGKIIWETDAWESVRSDSHQIAVRVCPDVLWVQGSPGRVVGDGDAVFSESVGLDLLGAVMAMISFVSTRLPCGMLPEARLWRVSKIDVTENYMMSSLADVRVALATLRGTEGGRYRVSQQAGDTVYWSHRSRLRSGKAYAKGPHLRHLMRKKGYTGRQYSEIEIENADKLVRLELSLKSQWWRDRVGVPWWKLSKQRFIDEYEEFFGRMIGKGEIEMVSTDWVDKCIEVAETEGRGRAAARTWAVIQSIGWQAARESMPKSTWYRHLKILRDAGLSDSDVSAGRVVGLRRIVNMQAVTTWKDLNVA